MSMHPAVVTITYDDNKEGNSSNSDGDNSVVEREESMAKPTDVPLIRYLSPSATGITLGKGKSIAPIPGEEETIQEP